ncbi:MAG: tRNA dihydrouridine synthase DusB [Clostridia bacterium]|nr:tRNA dihydrouridine synthase DusB [Clostridia bacterium]
MITIGSATFAHGLWLAPMAGYTDYALRRIAREMGAEATVTEMVSAKATVFGDKKTARLAMIREEDAPCAVQIFGSEADTLARAAERLSQGADGVRPFAIDINMGCPVPKVFGNGEGSALMRDPAHIRALVHAVVQATDLPVTVKLRSGIDDAHINAVDCALAAEDGGASAVAIHGRTRTQLYSGTADREIIKNVKLSVHIPVIANGDITSGEAALAMLRDTQADGLMVGRGVIGNPFIFREILAALQGASYTPPSLDERLEVALRQLRYAIDDKGEELAVRESRKQMAAYISGFRGAASLRNRVHQACTLAEVETAFEDLLQTAVSF